MNCLLSVKIGDIFHGREVISAHRFETFPITRFVVRCGCGDEVCIGPQALKRSGCRRCADFARLQGHWPAPQEQIIVGITTRAYRDALKNKLGFYDGLLCCRGHSIRYTKSGNCVACAKEATRRHAPQKKVMEPAKRNLVSMAYYRRNKEKHQTLVTSYRARKFNAPGKYNIDDVNALIEKQNGCCVYCKTDISKKRAVDHIIPLTKGGTNWPNNIQLLCKSCNSRKSDIMPDVFRDRFEKRQVKGSA